MLKTLLCTVVFVTDGDTLNCMDNANVTHKVRLAEIDAPEKRQDYGEKAKQHLSALVHRKRVTIKYKKKDFYGRTIGYVISDGNDINALQVKNGMAWVYERYSKSPEYRKLQKAAKDKKIGLWGHSMAIAPWEWRKGKRNTVIESSTSCKKTYCSEVNSCEQAVQLLKACNMLTLDRDGDGTPCEAICR